MRVEIHPSNFTKGRKNHRVIGVVIHIMQGTLKGTTSWFQNPASNVSSHAGVGKMGQVFEYVEYEDTAYHAGRINKPIWGKMKKRWGGYVNPNLYTYGIECEGFRGDEWTERQMASLTQQVRNVLDKAGLPYTRSNIVSHHEIAVDKEHMETWCDEVVKRLNVPIPVILKTEKQDVVNLLKQALELIKKL